MKKRILILIVGLSAITAVTVFVSRHEVGDRFDQFQSSILLYDDTSSRYSDDVSLSDELTQAINSGNEELVLRLLAQQSLTNTAYSQNSESLLTTAISTNRLAIARHLLQAGYDVHARGQNNQTALHVAVTYGYVDAVEFLFDNNHLPDAIDSHGRTALMLAVENRFYEIAQLLLSNGANPNIVDQSGRGPIHLAVSNTDEDIVGLLLNHGATPNVNFKNGGSILDKALEKSHMRIAHMLVKAGAKEDTHNGSAVRNAVGLNKLSVVRFLADVGFGMGIPDKKGDSPLVLAVKARRSIVTNALLKAGANPNTVDHYGRSVLSQAVNCPACVDHLIKAGVDVDYGGKSMPEYEDFTVSSPLIWAVSMKRTDTAERLLIAGADINLPDSKEGRPPIVHAARGRDMTKLISLLIKHGADPNSVDAGQWPALLQATSFSDHETVGSLIRAGANVNKANWHGWTPLMSATANGDITMSKLLLDKGANINARTRKGWTALSEAHHYGHFDLSSLLKAAGGTDPINPPMRTSKDRGNLEITIKVRD